MKYLNYILGGAVVVTLGVAAFFLKPVLGSTPYAGFTGVYNSSTITLRDGYGSALGTDENGYLLLSPSSTVGGGATSPLTTKGDIWAYGSADARFGVGTTGTLLMASSTASEGLAWISTSSLGISSGGSSSGTFGLLQYAGATAGSFDSIATLSWATTTGMLTIGTGNTYWSQGTASTYGGGAGNTAASGANYNTGFGNTSLTALTSGDYNTAYGRSSCSGITEGGNNVCIGYNAGVTGATISNTTVIGAATVLGANDNTLVGYGIGQGTSFSGGQNAVLGSEAMKDGHAAAAIGNAILGYRGGYKITGGDYNTLVGWGSGDTISTGLYNTLIGYNSDVSTNSFSTSTAIGYNAIAGASSKGVLGDGTIQWGIGTSTPAYTLQIATDGSATTTLMVGVDGTKHGCIILEDTDLAGKTYCSALNGTLTCNDTACP